MKKADDDVTAPSGDENCVSGLIGSVLTLIISILVWLQKVGCKNTAITDCPETCELLPALQRLSVFAKQSEEASADGSDGKACECPKHGKKKDKADKNVKKAKSGENHSVLYAVSQDQNGDQDCKKCCKKVVEPKEKKENDNVIFEVVAAQMAESACQTDEKEIIDRGTQSDEPRKQESATEAIPPCICSSTQVSSSDITKIETKNVGVQVEIEIKRSVKSIKEEDSCAKFKSEDDGYACAEPRFQACMDEDDEEEEDYEEEDDEEDYNEEPEAFVPCPTRCVSYGQTRQHGYRQQSPYPPMRQERPSFYRNYESPPMYNPGYDPYGHMRYPYQPQPYYQKVTRTIQRGTPGPRNPNQLQRQMSPIQRSKMSDNQRDSAGVEKFSQSDPVARSSSPEPTGQVNKRDSMNQRQQGPIKDKECVTSCPGKVNNNRKPSPAPVAPPPPPPPPPQPKPHSPVKKDCDPKCPKYSKPTVIEKNDVPKTTKPPVNEVDDATKTPSKKCVSKCATGGNQNKGQSRPNSADSKQKPRPVAFMPKGAIPVEPRDVLEVEEPPGNKQTILADSVMSVEASKRNK